jgi:hypothetical protein
MVAFRLMCLDVLQLYTGLTCWYNMEKALFLVVTFTPGI